MPTQKERRDETRRAVLDATVECLTELGFARTSTVEVQKRAGVSRGALLYHFPSKAGLLAEAVQHLAIMRGRELRDRAALLPEGHARVDAVIDLLWESFSGPLFYVAMELRNAARTDPEFRDVLAATEQKLRDRIVHQFRRLFGEDMASLPGFECAVDITLQLMIGAATSAALHTDRERVQSLIERWKTIFPTLLGRGSTRRHDK